MIDHGIEDRVVLVTGAGRGIGRGIAVHAGRLGAKVAISDIRVDRLDAVAADLSEAGIDHLASACDVSDPDAVANLVGRVVDRFGRIDGLVNNAQTFRPVMALEAVTPGDLDVLFDTGPRASLWAMQAVFPHMRDQGWGRIVNFGSANGITGAKGFAPYNMSKEAIRALTRTAAAEWAQYGIIVNCVCPASVAHRRPPSDPMQRAAWDTMFANHPMGRDGDAEDDIAPVVAFLLSDACRYLTGETLMVDGGGVMRA